MIVKSSWPENENCFLHRVYIIEFCSFGPKVKNSQDFDNIVRAKTGLGGAVLVRLRGTMWTLFFGTMTDDDCRIKLERKQKLFLK